MSIHTGKGAVCRLFHSTFFKHPVFIKFCKFCIVGFSGVFVDMGMVIFLKELFSIDTRIAAVFGFSMAVTTNYFLNRTWTFENGNKTPLGWSYLIYLTVCSTGLAVRLLSMHLMIEYLWGDSGYWYVATNFIGIIISTVVNFIGSNLFAFSPERFTFKQKKKL